MTDIDSEAFDIVNNKGVNSMRINRRIVNSQRHTTGFVLTGNRRVNRREAISMARKGQIQGVAVRRGPSGAYLASTGSRSLYSLPIDVDASSSANGSSSSRSRSRSRSSSSSRSNRSRSRSNRSSNSNRSRSRSSSRSRRSRSAARASSR